MQKHRILVLKHWKITIIYLHQPCWKVGEEMEVEGEAGEDEVTEGEITPSMFRLQEFLKVREGRKGNLVKFYEMQMLLRHDIFHFLFMWLWRFSFLRPLKHVSALLSRSKELHEYLSGGLWFGRV